MYDDDDNDQFNDNSSDVMGTLRAANKAQAKQLKELAASLETATNSVTELTGKVNATTVAKLLAAKGVDPGVSSFMIGVEPNEESINTWLATNGKLIGYDPTKGSDDGFDGRGSAGRAGKDAGKPRDGRTSGRNGCSPKPGG